MELLREKLQFDLPGKVDELKELKKREYANDVRNYLENITNYLEEYDIDFAFDELYKFSKNFIEKMNEGEI